MVRATASCFARCGRCEGEPCHSAFGSARALDNDAARSSKIRQLRICLFRVTDSGFVDLPVPALCSITLPVDIYMGTSVSMFGTPLAWNGSTWEPMASQFGGGGHNSYGVISGSASDDLYIVGAMQTQHFDGATWKPFWFHTIDVNGSGLVRSVWAVPWGGPRWGTSNTNVFEFSGGGWQDRGRLPGSNCAIAGWAAIGSDGADVFVTGEWVQQPPAIPPYNAIWIYRYSP